MNRFISASVTDRGLSEARLINEDSLLEVRELGIFAVADGVGGAEAGEVASQMAVEILAEAFTNADVDADPLSTMSVAIERANSAIYQLSSDIPQLERMATTIAAAHIGRELITIAHVGDSRVYRMDDESVLHRETEDHSFVNDEIRAGRMTAIEAGSHPGKNIINRALGADAEVEIELKSFPVKHCRSLLICTDGITAHVDEAEIREALSFDSPPEDICNYLKSICYERGARDNLTAIVVMFPPETEVSAADIGGVSSSHDDLLEIDAIPTSVQRPIEVSVEESSETQHLIDTQAPELPSREDNIFSSFDEPVTASGSSLFTPLIKTVGLLVLGAVVGVGAFMLGSLEERQAPPILELPQMASDSIPLTSFEKNRRNVDSDPAAFLRELPPPGDAEDHYLIGRARLLTGDFAGARSAFQEAKKVISDVDPVNRTTLEKEILLGTAIADSPAANETVRRELSLPKP